MRSLGMGLAALVLSSGVARADWPASVKVVQSEKGKTVEVKGDFKDGAPIADLSWAANSSVACFPATQNDKFRGNHVLYATSLPPRSVMNITVTPADPKQDVSIYAYEVGTNNFALPPDLHSCVSCEAEHKWDRPKKGKTQDHRRSVRLNAIGNPYNVVIGVSGPAAAKAGAFTLSVQLE